LTAIARAVQFPSPLKEVVKELRKIEYVKEAYVIYRVYDVIAKVEAETMEKLREVISSKIRRVSNVKSTLTMIVIEGT
jgi:DNA-binding Lrp family transcriptional regulator